MHFCLPLLFSDKVIQRKEKQTKKQLAMKSKNSNFEMVMFVRLFCINKSIFVVLHFYVFTKIFKEKEMETTEKSKFKRVLFCLFCISLRFIFSCSLFLQLTINLQIKGFCLNSFHFILMVLPFDILSTDLCFEE
jgi:hypothetical protein